MNIPNAVRIGGYRYEVERPEGPFYTDSGDLCDGLHVPNVQVIKVAKDGNDEYQKTVFLHECLLPKDGVLTRMPTRHHLHILWQSC